MRKKMPLVAALLLSAFLMGSCGAPHIRPGYGSYKGYHYRKYYKHFKPDYANPKMKKTRRN